MARSTRSPRIRLRVTRPPPTGGGGLPSAPSWVTALTVNRWGEVAMVNTPASVNPSPGNNAAWSGNSGQGSVVRAWNGGALAHDVGAKGTYCLWGGGHADYQGNEVYLCDLATRTWSRASDPYPTPGDGTRSARGWYASHPGQPNGSPGVPHVYRYIQYDPGRRCLVICCVQHDNGNPNQRSSKIGMFPLDGSPLPKHQWQEGPALSGVSNAASNSDGWGCFDSTRGRMIVHGGSGNASSVMCAIDPSVGNSQGNYGAWTNYGNRTSASGMGTAHDPINDCILIWRADSKLLRGLDAANLALAEITLAQSTPPTMALAQGFEYSWALGGYVVWDTGGTVYLVKKAAGGTWRTATWQWFVLTDAGNTVAPAKAGNGTYSRFRIMRYADAEVALVLNDVTQNLFAFRLA